MARTSQEKELDNQPLLESERQDRTRDTSIDSLDITQKPGRRKRPQYLRWLSYFLAIAYIPLMILYVLLFLKFSTPTPEAECKTANLDIFPSLARSSAIHFEQRPFSVKIHHNPFAGDPRPELDNAWHDLFEDIRIRVSKEDLDYYNLTSIPFADGSGYAAELGVYHELHCLKKIRHWIYKDYYLTNETEAAMTEWPAHIHHCIEMLRESIICHADPSLSTFKYLPGHPPTLTAVAKGHHQCVKWEPLMEWVRERHRPIFEEGVLMGPEEETRGGGAEGEGEGMGVKCHEGVGAGRCDG